MSDRLIGRIDNSSDASCGQSQFSQAWTPQAMKGKMDTSGPSAQVPHEFGNLQLVDNNHQQLKGYAGIRQPQQSESHFSYDQHQLLQVNQHHTQLRGNANEHQTDSHRAKSAYLVGQTTIPASNSNEGYLPSEKFSAKLPASTYQEGERFNQVLSVPAEKGKHNYYNGLANAHYEHGHLRGVPVHIVNGQVTAHLDHEVDLKLQKK